VLTSVVWSAAEIRPAGSNPRETGKVHLTTRKWPGHTSRVVARGGFVTVPSVAQNEVLRPAPVSLHKCGFRAYRLVPSGNSAQRIDFFDAHVSFPNDAGLTVSNRRLWKDINQAPLWPA
jgi:hypothetical protein